MRIICLLSVKDQSLPSAGDHFGSPADRSGLGLAISQGCAPKGQLWVESGPLGDLDRAGPLTRPRLGPGRHIVTLRLG
jgi:hypothetical protein